MMSKTKQPFPLFWVLTAGLTLGPMSGLPTVANGADSVLEKTSEAFNEVAKKATPAVVSISAVKAAESVNADLGIPFPIPPGPDTPGFPGAEPDSGRSFGIGSGVIIRKDGFILTNHHVVENAEKVSVTFDEKRQYEARVIGVDPSTDLAVIKINEKLKDLPVIEWGDSDSVEVGDWAVAIGSPFGLNHSVTSGIVSATGRGHMGVYDTENFIQTDAAINPGNSGGPLLNLEGKMIGVNAAIFSQTGGFMGIGFSIPSNMAREISEEIIKNGHVKRGWIGVVAQDLDQDLAKYFKVPKQKGALISDITHNGPASKSSLKEGDVIVKYDGHEVADSSGLKALVTKTRNGKKVELVVIRNGSRKEIPVQIQEQPKPEIVQVQKAGKLAKQKEPPTLGLAIQDIPDELQPLLGLRGTDGALVVDVDPGSRAFEAGIAPGDVILKANGKKIQGAKDFIRFTKKLGRNDAAVLYVQRGPEDKIFVPVKSTANQGTG